MKKLTDKELINKLKHLPVKPDGSWQKESEKYIHKLASGNVPESRNLRNNIMYVFNILFMQNMNPKAKVAIFASVFAAFLILGGGAAVYAADDSAPGDALYPIDKGWESLQRAFVNNPEKSAEFEMDVLEERVRELEQLQNQNAEMKNIEKALGEVEQQQERVQERVRNMEEKHLEGEVDEGTKERIQNRYEKQNEEHEEIMNKVKNQYNKDDEETNTGNSSSTGMQADDPQGEPGGVGVQQRPQDQDRDGYTGNDEGNHEDTRPGWE